MAKANLSVIMESAHGKAGNVVFRKDKDGTHIVPHVKGTDPNTAAQQGVRTNLRKASGAFKNLSPLQYGAWKNFASNQTMHDPTDGSPYKPTPMSAFMKLACKFLQVDPDGTIPLNPPTAPFYGDDITITVTGGTNELTFTASAANSANVTTEILLQPLASVNRKPQKRAYRHKAFFKFVSGTLSTDIAVPAGYFASGYRFVNTLTGQATGLYALNVQTVTFAIAAGGKNETKKAA